MIYESRYWKTPLLLMARRLKRFQNKEIQSPADSARIERDVFIGFFSIRKLMEAKTKLTEITTGLKINLTWFKNIKQVTLMNNDRIEDLYSLSKKNSETRDLEFVANQFVHSYVFVYAVDEEGGLIGFYFSSDVKKNSRLYFISLEEVIRIFNTAGNDYPAEIILRKQINKTNAGKDNGGEIEVVMIR